MTSPTEEQPTRRTQSGRTPLGELVAFYRAALVTRVERDHTETAAQLRRRRIVVAITVVAGSIVLGLALAIPPGDPRFYLATLGLAAVWAVGALASGRLYLGRAHRRTGGVGPAFLHGFIVGMTLLGLFCAGAALVARIPALLGPVQGLLDHALFGSLAVVALITAINGIAEELFFRGALYAALPPRWNVIASTVLYAASTLGSGVPLLTFAALALGLVTGLQRRVTGGVLAPIVCHLTWSLGMLFALPPLFQLFTG
ncbi:type II CAAX endopeptidase family protein [Ammonicoccus fulvus]|uniref:Type II CAAX endopeptidase family protein n=1 Tax=Ammonicoccus fulvus TaxID=3138240 RepID=A0ABZ3FJP9_9ACTN